MVIEPGKGVGEGTIVAVAVGSGVNVGGTGEGISVDGTGVDETPQPAKAISATSARKTNPIDLFIDFSPLISILRKST